MKINTPTIDRVIDHLIPGRQHHFIPEYLRQTSERLFQLQDVHSIKVSSSSLIPINRDIGFSDVTTVYQEAIVGLEEPVRVWKIRNKEKRKSRRSFSYEAFILSWLKQRLAPVPQIVALVNDITDKAQKKQELKEFYNEDDLNYELKRNVVRKEGLVVSKIRETRLDLDLMYLKNQIDNSRDPVEIERYNEQKMECELSALQSIMALNTIADNYYLKDFWDSDFEVDQSIREVGPFIDVVKENIERVVLHNIIYGNDKFEGRLIDREGGQIEKFSLEKEVVEDISRLFRNIDDFLRSPQSLGFVQGEAHPFHLGYSSAKDYQDSSLIWNGYVLFDFDKAKESNCLEDIVTYLNNPLMDYSYEVKNKMFIRALGYAVKKIGEMSRESTGHRFPLMLKPDHEEKLSDDETLEKLRPVNVASLQAVKGFIKDDDKNFVFSNNCDVAYDMIDKDCISHLAKAKDYMSLVVLIRNLGRACKREYGASYQGYAKMPQREKYVSRFTRGKSIDIPYADHYSGQRNRMVYSRMLNELFDNMINNNKYLKEKKGLDKPLYRLNSQEIDEIKRIKHFFENLDISYKGKDIPVRILDYR